MNITGYTKQQLIELIEENRTRLASALREAAFSAREQYYGRKVYFRGLIEFTNYCKNDCYYCGIRCGNRHAVRYRLTEEQILECCAEGYRLGFRTFVLQGGEDGGFADSKLCGIISAIKARYPDCAVTLSVGERDRAVYQAFFDAGADRYLLRHETATESHYTKLHPSELQLEHRKQCLYDLKEIGFQVGAGFMVGSPYQTTENLAEDLLFLRDLQPHMVGLGPFVPHKDTRFAQEPAGTLELTLTMLALTRLTLPKVLLPATTALGTIAENGRELAFSYGANVVMPNLSPADVRGAYLLYDNKANTGDEAAEGVRHLEERIRKAGFEPDFSRGDAYGFKI